MVKKNQIIEIKIDDINFPNKGVGIFEGDKIVIKDTIPGQTVSARISKKRSSGIEGSLIEVIERSPLETEIGCKHFGICGGCSYQKLTYQNELELKKNQVLKLLDNAGISGYEFLGIIDAPEHEGYRNKCEFSFGDEYKGGPIALGMRKKGSFYEVVNLTDCNIIDEDYLKVIKTVKEFFENRNIPFYHKSTHEGQLRHLVVRKGAYTGEILINLVTTSEITFSMEELKDAILDNDFKGTITGILHTKNDSIADIVKSDETNIIYGKDYFMDKLLGLDFKVSAFSFFQTNTLGAEKLYSVVRDFVGDTKDKVVFDLYCGTGTIGQIVAKNARKVIGIELVEEAVEAARKNALLNGIDNCEFIAGDILKKVDEIKESPDLIVVDPPRDGIHPKAITKIIDFGASEIVYVSCKPTSLARDLQVFEQNGYKVKKVVLVNQFPRTNHVECVVLLSRVDK